MFRIPVENSLQILYIKNLTRETVQLGEAQTPLISCLRVKHSQYCMCTE